MFAKEEEICELQVKLRERDTMLYDYKKENARFAVIQQKYNADIAALQQQVSATQIHILHMACNQYLRHFQNCSPKKGFKPLTTT